MAKREYRKGEDARRVLKIMRLSEDEAKRLAVVADAVGKSDGELTRHVLLTALRKFETTGAIILDDEIIRPQLNLFGEMTKTTKQCEAAMA